MFAQDPELAVEAALLDGAQQERSAARSERAAAAVTRDQAQRRQLQELEESANWKLASGILSGAGQMAQGACTAATTTFEVRQQQAENAASDAADRLRASPQDASAQRAVETARSNAQQARLAAGNARAVGQETEGVFRSVGAGLDYASTQAQTAATAAQQEADRARERMQDAGERASEAQQRSLRLLDRMGQLESTRAQAAQTQITNLRG